MKDLIIFMAGVLTGAGIALLTAPESGEQLRADMRAKAEEELPKLQSVLDKTNERLNKLETDMQGSLNQS